MTAVQAAPPGRYHTVLAQLGDREPSSTLEVQAVIEGIRTEKGYLDPDVLQGLNSLKPEHRDCVLRIVDQKKETEAAYTTRSDLSSLPTAVANVTSISEQLYSSKYRFLYEVVQNADDSHYCNAENNGSQPFLRFKVTPQSFIIETNEDGFNRKNVEAICATGKSSKKNSLNEDFTGEKGFGFKSVFSIADEVHVQSGLWSFRFEHRNGDDGLGMVTPLDATTEELPSDITTRITLRLTSKAATEYERMLEAIADMPDTTLFFLRKLAIIHVDITHVDTRKEIISICKLISNSDSTVHINRSRTMDGEEQVDKSLYLKVTHTINNLPIDNRRRGKKTACIDLAFPVNAETKQPKLCSMGQHVFAYLPLQRLPQLQFLIQSDFITAASRENVIDCDWNAAICRGVVAAFTKAVKTFAVADHPLRYSWLAFLPTMPMEKPWRTMYTSIVTELRSMTVFETWETRQFRKLGDLRRLPPRYLFEGRPILKDLADEIYIAPEYDNAYEKVLDDLGIENINWNQVVARVQADLVMTKSRIKGHGCDSPWFEAFAALCTLLFALEPNNAQNLLKKQPLIPLTNSNQWTGAPGMGRGGLPKVYFPCAGTISIPTDIGLPLLSKSATTKTKVKEFYAALGVENCPPATVLAKIREVQSSGHKGLNLESHLRYLFHNHDRFCDFTPWLLVPTDHEPRNCDWRLYFPSTARYSTETLLTKETRVKSGMQCGIISTAVLKLEPTTVRVNDRTWKTWLREVTKARDHPPLIQRSASGVELSIDMANVLKFNPSNFLGTLKEHWTEYQRDAPKVKDILKRTRVLCRSMREFHLHDTYLPTSEVLGRLRELHLADINLPILCLPDGDLDESLYHEWRFLEDFGVRSKPDLRFYKLALDELAAADDTTIQQTQSLYKSMAQLTTFEDHQDLRAFFDKRSRILSANGWVGPYFCVWRGPGFLRHTVVLETCYPKDSYLESFFTTTLNIKNSTRETIVSELQNRNWENPENPESLSLSETCQAYEFLDSHTRTVEESKMLRSVFKNYPLVSSGKKTWHRLSKCYWSSPSPLEGYIDLQSIYPDLKSFFTQKLGVKKASPAMLIKDVKKMAEQEGLQAEGIRDRLIEIGTILAKGDLGPNIEAALLDLLKVKFLPKRLVDGNLVLVGEGDDFAILDHVRYGQALADRGILLDFDIHETQILHIMFQKLGFTSRYLSKAVSEQSSVGHGSVQDAVLSRQLQARAYALYCCAAKHKSRKALRDDHDLFDLLAGIEIHTSDNITTDLVLQLSDGPLRVHSDRSLIYHSNLDGKLKIYVPKDLRDRRACYRSHLPQILVSVTGSELAAMNDISVILSCSLDELDDVLQERDITDVSWITKPTFALTELRGDEQSDIREEPVDEIVQDDIPSATPNGRENSVDSFSASSRSRVRSVPVIAINDRSSHDRDAVALESEARVSQQEQYRRLLEQLIVIAKETAGIDLIDFNNQLPFGRRETNEFVYNRRIGAAGEAFVFERLSTLNLPQFSHENWQSTIRGEVNIHPQYASLSDWRGRETTDLVYTDRTGHLTRYLRDHCNGGFPDQIPMEHDHALHPVEYFLEVKSTPGRCSTRFYMSDGQYNRMEETAMDLSRGRMRVYVIMRVFNLTAVDANLSIFVDPLKFKGTLLNFAAEKWFVSVQ